MMVSRRRASIAGQPRRPDLLAGDESGALTRCSKRRHHIHDTGLLVGQRLMVLLERGMTP